MADEVKDPPVVETQQEETQQEEVQPEEIQQEETVKLTADQQEAVDFYNNLKDPEKAEAFLNNLAKKAGVKLVKEGEEPPTKREIRKTAEQMLTAAKAKVPAQFQTLFDGFLPGIEELINQRTEEQRLQLDEVRLSTEENRFTSEMDAISNKLSSEYKDYNKLDNEMSAIAKEMPYQKGTSLEKYLRNIYKLAVSEKTASSAVANTVRRINNNARSADNATSVQAPNGSVQHGSRLPTLDEALAAGMRNERI